MAVSDQILGVESGGDPNAKNPNSSASGAGQFINSTWLDTLAKHRPDIQGTPAELLAMRSDPQLSRDMTAAYASDNAGILQHAGLPVTPGTTYLAHFAGPSGAKGILSADPSTPAIGILGAAAVKANPFLANMTAGDVANWANRKMGGPAAPLAMVGPAAASQPQAPAAPLSIAPPAAPHPVAQLQWGGGQPAPAPQPMPQQTIGGLLPPRKIYALPQAAPLSWGSPA